MDSYKINLAEKDISESYLNISYYLNKYLGKLPEPPLHPGTKQPAGPADLSPIFPMGVIMQEVSLDEFVPIPDEVRELYKMFRPSPLMRAYRLEKELSTPAHIYYKYEGGNATGSHKLNSALAQAYYNKQEGVETIVTETGAGQWGSALSIACHYFGLKCKVFMVRISYDQKPYRKVIMKMYGSDVHSSPSIQTEYGRKVLQENPDTPGSLGIAISEALELAVQDEKTKYALGSVLNHVLLHQTIIGQEAKKQMEMAGEYPDTVIGCCGGGSNFAGIAFPFIADTLSGARKNTRFIGVEPASCPSLTKGEYKYDFGDTACMTPLLKMKTLGSDFIPSKIHAGGLRYHGMAPLVSFLHEEKFIEARAYEQLEVFEAGVKFARTEGIIPAPESSHAIKAAIDEAMVCKETGESKVILFNLSGNGMLDLQGYDDFLSGKLKN
ncbi:MAG TPA: TrpB-like pyridoxal phosphate-dependent enzyme [Candidatus Magasanikbacteria bacterium]|nr:TrpB-like pyridoxal phosphate-dependent enzyme [Candidatus Magasanikbacteria bacterium]